jgi:hypothetical protein
VQDVTRTFPEEPYFESPEVQQRMVDMLFYYSKMNPDVGYRQVQHPRPRADCRAQRFTAPYLATNRPVMCPFVSQIFCCAQGMHELLAAILLLVDRDSEHLRELGPEVEASEAETATRYIALSEADLALALWPCPLFFTPRHSFHNLGARWNW